jgi:predicted dinucleotide-binding enzyme
MSRIAVIGSGEVGRVLAAGLRKHGHDVRIASRSPERLAEFSNEAGIPATTLAEAARWSEGAVLAVRGDGALEAVRLAGPENMKGKWVLDTTNPIAKEPPDEGVLRFFTGPNDSLTERLQAAFPDIRFVKAFNSVGSVYMVNPTFPPGVPGTMFYCGNDAPAKKAVADIIRQFGWEGWDMGGAKSARALEPLCQLWCLPGFLENRWNQAFRLMPM